MTVPALLLLLAACTVGPNYQRPAVPIPENFYGATQAAEAASLADAPWFDVFQDPVLRALIDEALRNGFEPRIAAARVEEARARFGISESLRYPDVDYQVGLGRSRVNEETSNRGGASVGASWEADLWGRIRRLNEAARAQYLATEEGRRAVTLSLVAEVATAYFDLRALDAELDIARRSTAAFRDTRDLFHRRLEGGTASAVETARAEALLANSAAVIPLLERAIVATENRINFLAGRPPGPVARGAALTDQPLPPSVPAGLPSSLLLRRPDIRQSEQFLIAANANIGVAEAAFYPTLSLTGLLGVASPELSNLFDEGRTWSIQSSLLGPIFNAGRLRNQRRAAVAQFDQARIAYEADITNALGEVSTALVSVEKLRQVEEERTRAVRANEEAVRLVTLRYESGLSAYFEVLDAMERLLAAENNLAETRRDRLVALVAFYRALGGGWDEGS
ncbi:MAG TPA: efflux transporter outer membrane subunit [Thermoanaerobaculia bacterium]|nr:efflux transporter outer membrane subunit [Thermoanaerobaculia bacterium]